MLVFSVLRNNIYNVVIVRRLVVFITWWYYGALIFWIKV